MRNGKIQFEWDRSIKSVKPRNFIDMILALYSETKDELYLPSNAVYKIFIRW